ncbi:MAG: Ldh family oxidoreductase [Opitutales bacterium]|nr:Ldh family oxidoreductase [Opitutales bacterium]
MGSGKPHSEIQRFPAEDVYNFVEAVLLKSEVEEQAAKVTARGLWQTSLRGVDSHGIRLLLHYIQGVRGGRVNPQAHIQFEKTSATTGRVDADHGFGHAAGMLAMKNAIEMARESGSGQVAVANSNHCGSMAYFALEAAKNDMIGTAYTNASPNMRSANATTRFFGTNPICMAAPMSREGPFCYDGATTMVALNKIRNMGDQGQDIPNGWGADSKGKDTTDPAAVSQLLPMGDYKGFGLAMIVDILCGVMTGMPTGDQVTDMFRDSNSEKRHLGHFFTATRIDAFQEASQFKDRLQELADRIRQQPRQDEDTPVMIPGDSEKASEADRKEFGMPINEAILSDFRKLAEELDLEMFGSQS